MHWFCYTPNLFYKLDNIYTIELNCFFFYVDTWTVVASTTYKNSYKKYILVDETHVWNGKYISLVYQLYIQRKSYKSHSLCTVSLGIKTSFSCFITDL